MKGKPNKQFYMLIATVILLTAAFSIIGKADLRLHGDYQISGVAPEENVLARDSVVNYALEYLGTPYVYGSCSEEGFDCSGFVYYVFKHFDIDVPRSSSLYEDFGEEVPIE